MLLKRGGTSQRPLIRGSFVQPWRVRTWGQPQWRRELRDLRRAGLDQVILQWTADTQSMLVEYPTKLGGYTWASSVDVVEEALKAADAEHMSVVVGLQTNHDFFGASGLDPTWLAQEAVRSKDLAGDLERQYGHHPSFVAWYLPFEVDNVRFPAQEQWDLLAGYYRSVSEALAGQRHRPVMTAPFFTTTNPEAQTPEQWKQMWTYLLKNSPLDVLALQDGVGAGHAKAADLAMWFGATRAAVAGAGGHVELWDDAETYTEDTGKRRPMDVRAIAVDLAAAGPFVNRVVSFSFDHYLAPQQGFDAQYRAYLRYADCRPLDVAAPSVAGRTDSATREVCRRRTGRCDRVRLHRDGSRR